MARTNEMGEETIRFERIYDASLEDVWALWTTKQGLEQWFAPEGMHFEVSVLELRIGGAFDHVMTAVGSEQVAYMDDRDRPHKVWVSGRFMEIVPRRRLRIRFDIDFVPGVASYPYDMAVDLYDESGRVRMVLTADRHPDAEMTRGARLALITQLKRLDAAVAATSSTKDRP